MKKTIGKISILFCIAVLVGLGIWQLKRMEYKNDLIKNLGKKLSLDPVLLHDMPSSQHLYQRIKICGHYLENSELFVYYRPSYMLLSSFYIENTSQNIIIARGLLKQQNSLLVTDTARVCITGLLLPSEKKPLFMPEYNGTKTKPLLSINAESVGEILSLKLPNLYLLLVPNQNDVNNNDLEPLKIPDPQKIYNPHLGYAITWFALAFILIFMWRFNKKRPCSNL